MPTGSPVVTPKAFAGMDFARIMPVRLSRSPPIGGRDEPQIGLPRRSAPRRFPGQKLAVHIHMKNQADCIRSPPSAPSIAYLSEICVTKNRKLV